MVSFICYTRVFVLFFLVFNMDSISCKRKKRSSLKCDHRSGAVYNLTFYGDWTPTSYPRMYPTSRPHAQWSKLIGRTHDETYRLWAEGIYANPALKEFAETGETTIYEKGAQGYGGSLDFFTAAPIRSGLGSTSVKVIADGYHHFMSFLVKMVPSPDWFVGIDSVNLCRKGRWRGKVIAKLRPLDAGTDRGLTFTAPNWPINPPEKVHKLTPKIPDHPASSFFYENVKKLPKIARIEMYRIADLKIKNGRTFDDRELSNVQETSVLPKQNVISPGAPLNERTVGGEPLEPGVHSLNTSKNNYIIDETTEGGSPQEIKLQGRDCTVSEWSEFTSCSKTCGYGHMERTRKIIQPPVNGGVQCPNMIQRHVCGSMRNCEWKHFSLFRGQSSSPKRRASG